MFLRERGPVAQKIPKLVDLLRHVSCGRLFQNVFLDCLGLVEVVDQLEPVSGDDGFSIYLYIRIPCSKSMGLSLVNEGEIVARTMQ